MLRTRTKIGTGSALAVGVALAIGGGIGSASAAPEDSVDSWVVPQTQAAGSDYWTSERMLEATPADVLFDATAAKKSATSAVDRGEPITVAAQKASSGASTKATPEAPIAHIGKVFFTSAGGNYVCSGNAVASGNRSVVSTAGHCLNEGPGAFVTNFVFVPAYENGNAPYGQFPAIELHAPTQWTQGGDISYDTGFAVVGTVGGSSLIDTVGGSGLSFNDSTGLTYDAYGYPAASPFTGETLQSCYGSATPDPYGQSDSQGIPCDMTGGSSGGPWFLGGSSGAQNSVNSFGYNAVANTMFGPYWGSVIAATYDQAAS